jgi:hypothetical protein
VAAAFFYFCADKSAKGFLVKKFRVFFVILVCLLALGLAFTSCGDLGGETNGGGGDWPITISEGDGWPSNELLAKYKVSSMPKPNGSEFFYYEMENETDFTLTVIFLPANKHGTELRDWFKSNGYEESDYSGTFDGANYVSYRFSNDTNGIRAGYECSLRTDAITYAILGFSYDK